MGGAERNARKKKQEQQAAKAVAAARGAKGDQTKVIIGVVVVVVLALVVVGGVIWSKSGSSGDTLTPPDNLAGVSAPIKREGGVVVVGQDTAKATIDIYEDFLCPACGQFKKIYGAQIKDEIEKGTLRVRYHALPFLIRMSAPEGYSRDAANAALCAADQDKFWQYHESLFAKQPDEGGPGYTKQQLVQLGNDLGISDPSFKTCVDNDTHVADAQSELDKARATSYFKGTPTVAKDDQPVDFGDNDWLTNLVK
ncbi:thioredoxin domain-containing protein [Actinosynnema sp. NPDC047251]|uniref:Protein-disulfide isomerase-like protein n=1 Tax=Saccharothrix espanaensis (strain ATCC 51144 / DSM 44229 / JCM 9112 / NBRC 15066 / NRRL 15764) TaxID=1179773 RepID=K0JU76_SACES|nr:thioredoxin domain-containing protein [Saccharothrix espanaensis]CCH28364.1 Protein-disulfide isomerase-like protein [Saccharothrix espanaensis DSM 44229]